VQALVQAPDILLLDEPTNHLDLAGIQWLEELLESASFACVAVSHDRYFLENVATEMAELNRAYPDGILRVHGNYSTFLIKKERVLARPIEAAGGAGKSGPHGNRMACVADPKRARPNLKPEIDRAHEMIGELANLNARTKLRVLVLIFPQQDAKPNVSSNSRT